MDELNRTTNPNAIVTDAPEEHFRLNFFDVACLIINRTIGTGIFNAPGTVTGTTQSAGGAILLWFFGIFYALAGMHVYIEFGLNVPRYVIEGIEQSVPRSGGDLHYLQYVYRWLYYKKDTVLYSGCLYGITFIFIGNMANNCINFASRVLQGAHPGVVPDNGHVRGVAMAAAVFACLIHGVSRRGGIWLNNLFALVKVGLLLVIVGTTLAVVGKGIKDADGNVIENVFGQNLDPKIAFQPPLNPNGTTDIKHGEGSANSYAAAFLSIMFAYSGFEQNNYVLGEIARPRRTFPRATVFAVALIATLYMVVNLCFMAVVPAWEQDTDVIALLFFRKTFAFAGPGVAERVFNAFLALSSFGNIIVMTYTAARMKQEIAKQGFLPFAKFFGQNRDVSIGRLVMHLRRTRGWKLGWIAAEQHREATPVGALTLHLASCVLLIFATYRVAPGDAYNLLANLDAYITSAFFGFFLALGIIILRIWGPPATEPAKTKEYREKHHDAGVADDAPVRKTWTEMVNGSVKTWLSWTCAVIYLVGNAFPLIALWIPGTGQFASDGLSWWLVPTIAYVVLGFASVWWLSFLVVAKYREHHQQKSLIYEIRPEFAWADPAGDHDPASEKRQRDGGVIMVHETVLLQWYGGEMDMFDMPAGEHGGDFGPMFGQDHEGFGSTATTATTGARLHRRQQPAAPAAPAPVNEFANTDFDDFGPPPPVAGPTHNTQW
ncbi:amino acid permease-domain-containing protein [Apodospora peruviana]|uniref:Amino acid permease-domain-containing protein n=1 Tax=Apodospora peruviana TaxID=516989 RepID=A0AAE0M129_9PEZI|nr:amino acid permease-domain-containing protein [Apodospora peruviana]